MTKRILLVIGVLLVGGWAMGMITLNPLWSLAPGDRTYLTTDNTQRGMAYNPVTGHVLVANRAGGISINILDGATGADLGSINMTGVTGGTFALNLIGVGGDGAIYGCNLTTDSTTSPFKVYRWENESAVPTVAFSGDPAPGASGGTGPRRFGDALDVRGSGTGTQIIAGARTGVDVAWLSTANGTDFTSTQVTTAAVAGDFGLGVTFADGNTFWGKSAGYRVAGPPPSDPRPLSQISLETGAVLNSTTAVPLSLTALDWASLSGWLDGQWIAGLHFENPAEVRLYDMSDPNNPAEVAVGTLPTNNANLNGTGQPKFGAGNTLYVLGSNNGIAAFQIVPEPATMLLAAGGLGLLLRRRRS